MGADVRQKLEWNLGLGVNTLGAQRQGTEWIARASGGDGAACPSCGSLSRSRKARYRRKLHDLPMQGNAVTLSLELSRCRCRNLRCPEKASWSLCQVSHPRMRGGRIV
jgi:transposase